VQAHNHSRPRWWALFPSIVPEVQCNRA